MHYTQRFRSDHIRQNYSVTTLGTIALGIFL